MIYFTELGTKKSIAFNPAHIVTVEESLDPQHSKIRTVDGNRYHVDHKQLEVVGDIIGALRS